MNASVIKNTDAWAVYRIVNSYYHLLKFLPEIIGSHIGLYYPTDFDIAEPNAAPTNLDVNISYRSPFCIPNAFAITFPIAGPITKPATPPGLRAVLLFGYSACRHSNRTTLSLDSEALEGRLSTGCERSELSSGSLTMIPLCITLKLSEKQVSFR